MKKSRKLPPHSWKPQKDRIMSLCVKECKKHLSSKLISVMLFGSAVHSADKANDYDLLVVTKTASSRDWQTAGEIKAGLIGKVDKPVDIVVMAEEDLKYPGPLTYEVCQNNRLLYGKDILPEKKQINRLIRPLMVKGVKIGWKVAQ